METLFSRKLPEQNWQKMTSELNNADEKHAFSFSFELWEKK
jgi:hypothetical protein